MQRYDLITTCSVHKHLTKNETGNIVFVDDVVKFIKSFMPDLKCNKYTFCYECPDWNICNEKTEGRLLKVMLEKLKKE